jgi:hypothetical protein
MLGTIVKAEEIVKQVVNTLTADEIKSLWDGLHRVLDRIMPEQSQDGAGTP